MEDYNSVYKHIQICIGQFTKIGYIITQNNSQIIVNMPTLTSSTNKGIPHTNIVHTQSNTHSKDNIADSS